MKLLTRKNLGVFLALLITASNFYAQCPITVNATPATSTICPGSSVNLNATSSAAGTSFSWSPSTGLSSTSISNPVASPTTTTTYTVTGMLANGANLVTNGNFEAGNVAFSSQYDGTPTPGTWGLLSDPGTYAVSTSASNVHNNFANFADHSANPGTQYMIVNGSVGSGTKVWCQTFSVVPGTTYVFSVWVTNVENTTNAAQLASLNFDINGVNIGSNFTPTLGLPNWTQYTTSWTCPAGTTSITLCIENTNLQEAGNDFGLDDIAFQTACTATSSVTVNVINPVASNNGPVCSGQSVNLSSASFAGATYSWSGPGGFTANTQNATASPTASGTYTVNVTSGGVTCPATTSVIVNPNPTASVSPVSPVCLGGSVNLSGTVSGPVNTSVTLSNNTSMTINDGGVSSGWTGTGGAFATSDINVTGLNTNWTLTSVVLNITHAWDGDVIVWLFNPCGNSIALINGNGGSGDNFTNTTFTPGATTAISAGAAPFNGTFIPAEGAAAWNAFITASQGCASANGVWSIHAGDYVGVDQGTLTSWTINFSNPNNTTFAWSPTTNMTNSTTLTPTVTPTSAGTTAYTLTATNTYGCVATATVNVTAAAAATANANVDQQVCAGGTVNLSGIIGGSASSATWSAASGTFSNTGSLTSTYTPSISSGSVTLTLTSDDPAGSCVAASDQMVITVVSAITPNAGPDQTICTGGSVQIGNDPIWTEEGSTYTWSNGAGSGTLDLSGGGQNHGTVTVSPASTTTYTVSVTSPGGCTATDQVQVTVNPLATANANIDQSVCSGGTITLNGSVGGSATSGVWSAPSGTFSNSSSLSSTYTPSITSGSVTLTLTSNDPTGPCTSVTDQMIVTISAGPTVTVNSPTICSGATAMITATPGTVATYDYSWTVPAGVTNPGNVASFSANVAGTYSVVITNSVTGCVSSSASGTLTVNPLPTVVSNDVSVCNSSSVTVNASGANSYSWSPGTYLSGTSGSSVTFTAGSTTTYTVTGTSAEGCTNTDAVTVTVSSTPSISAGPDVSICSGQSTTLNASGGVTYSWNPASLGTNPSVSVSPTSTTTYTVTGTSTGSCVATDDVTVTVNPLPTATISGTTTVCSGASSPTITFTGSNGSLPYTFTYTINGGSNQTVTSTGSTATVNVSTATTGTFTYSLVSVQDASTTTCSQGQSGSATVTVSSNPTPIISGPLSYCTGGTTTLSTSSYSSYLWSPTGATTQSAQFTQSNNPISVTVTNSSGCTGTSAIVNVSENSVLTHDTLIEICQGQSTVIHGISRTVAGVYSQTYALPSGCDSVSNVTLTVNPLPAVNAGSDITTCQNQNVTLTATGAAGITWSGGINNGVPFTQPIGSMTYTATGTDANGCENTDQVQVTVNPLPTATITGTNSVCVGSASQTITFTGSNGTEPYTFTYQINGGANQTVSSVGSSATVNAPTSTAGSFVYSLVSVQDASSTSCSQTQTGSATITVNPLPTATINGTTAVCTSASSPNITLTGSGGTAPYTFTYNINGDANQTITSVGSSAIVSASTSTAGTFAYNLVSVQDASSTACSQAQSGSAIITINPLPTGTISGTTTICAGTTAPNITFTGANGTTPYTFTYNINGGTNQTVLSVGSTVTVTVPSGTPGTFVYNLISIQDASSTGCSQTQTGSATVTINQIPSASASGTNAVCLGASGQNVIFTGSNGTAPYTFTYNINGGANQNVTSTGNSATVVASTSTDGVFVYNLINVQDAGAAGCSQSLNETETITVNPLPTATINGSTSVCIGSTNPNITFTGANGTAPYTFTYNINGGTNQTVTSAGSSATVSVPTATAGTFTYSLVSVQDASSTACSQSQTGSATITINQPPTAAIGGSTTVCIGAAPPDITFTGSNGNAPYTFTYNINGGANQTIISSGSTATVSVPTTGAGTFIYNIVNVEDASTNGCSQAQSGNATITVLANPIVSAGADLNLCQGESASLSGSGATSYTWDNGINNGVEFTPSVGSVTYIVTGTSAEGCVNTDQVTINVNPTPQIDFTPSITSGCVPLTVTFTNTTPNATDCSWSMGDGSSLEGNPSVSHTFTQSGCFDITLTLIDANGCMAEITHDDLVCVEENPIAEFTSSQTTISEFDTYMQFFNSSVNANSYEWNFGDGSISTIENPDHDYAGQELGSYIISLIATSAFGCVDTAYSTILIQEELIYFIPNTFTPDGDMFNQTFKPIFTSGYDPYNYTLYIYNRWGELIFETHSTEYGWDGTYGQGGQAIICPDGVYTWKIDFKLKKHDDHRQITGHVNLMR